MVLLFVYASGQQRVSVDSVYHLIKVNNVHTRSADWKQIDEGFRKKLAGAKTDVDSIRSLVYVFEQLKDYHSSISYKNNYFSNYPDFDEATMNYLRPLVGLSQSRTNTFTALTLEDQFVYLQIPGVTAYGEQTAVFAQRLSDTLCKYVQKGTKGIILDLRLNGGGQFSSMASGVAPLLGDIYIGGGINSNNDQIMSFRLKNGNITMNNYPLTAIKHTTSLDLSKLPVVLILGPATRSSGSILAVAFKSRPKTYFIGEPTASGYTTSNDYFYLNENLSLNLSTAFTIDRNNKVYKEVVEPDELLKSPDNFDDIKLDTKVKKGLLWLKQNSR